MDNIIHNRALIAGVSGPSDGSGAKMEDPQRSSLPSAPRGKSGVGCVENLATLFSVTALKTCVMSSK